MLYFNYLHGYVNMKQKVCTPHITCRYAFTPPNRYISKLKAGNRNEKKETEET